MAIFTVSFSSSAAAAVTAPANYQKHLTFSTAAAASASTRPNQVYGRPSVTAYATGKFTASGEVGELTNGRYTR